MNFLSECQNFYLKHYIKYADNENDILKKEYEDDEIYLFLNKDKGEANNYIRRILPNPKEKIIADIFKNDLRNSLKSSIQQCNLVMDRDNNNISSQNCEIDK